MKNQDYAIIDLTEQNILSFASYLPDDRLEWIFKENVAAYGLLKNKKTACGAIMFSFYPEEGAAYLESICVDESLRRCGLGTMLYEEFEDEVRTNNTAEIRARIIIPDEDNVRIFLEANGFNRFENGERYYEFTKDDIMTWLKNPKSENIRKTLLKDNRDIVVPVSKASGDLKKLLPNIPYNPDLSYMFKDKEKENYILADADDEGNIIILDIALDLDDYPEYFLFLESAMLHYTQKLSESGKLYITVTSDAEAELIESLSFKEEFEYSTRIDMAKTVSFNIPDFFDVPHSAFIVPRINGLSKMLSDFGEGYEHTVAYAGDNATINILRDADKPEVYLNYDLTDKGNAEGYELTMITCFYKSSLTKEQQEKFSKWREESAICSFTEDDDGHIFARAAIVEGKGLVSPTLLKAVLDSFMAEIDNMCSLDKLPSIA